MSRDSEYNANKDLSDSKYHSRRKPAEPERRG